MYIYGVTVLQDTCAKWVTLSFDHQWWNLITQPARRKIKGMLASDIPGLWLMTSVSAKTKIQVYPGGKGEAVEEICKPSRKLTYLTFGKGTLYLKVPWPVGICWIPGGYDKCVNDLLYSFLWMKGSFGRT